MITVAHRWKELKIAFDQYSLCTMLVTSCHEKIDIPFPTENRKEPPAALPVTVRDLLPMKFVEDPSQLRWHRFDTGLTDQADVVRRVHLS
ncbi:hypothetical protein LMTR3_09235 [Bradyrhizobium sp. LMTR 3]|nr:hypothetical protein LMTR3_09235 [Bradyrhizobium sp. LMTR 3]